MNSVFSEQILADKLSKLNSTQQCIETLSHWCIFHRSKAELVVTTWEKQFHSAEMVQKVPLLYLANDILQNSKRKGNEFVGEFWKVLPAALKELVGKGDDHGKNVVSRLVNIWEERRVFGSRARSLKDVMLGEELPPPLELNRKRSRSVKIMKRDSRSIRTKLTIGSTVERIVSAIHLVLSERAGEDEEMSKCKSAVHHVRKMETDIDLACSRAKDPKRKTLSKDLEEEENLLKDCIEKLQALEANRVALVSQLREALNEQESELENVRTQIQVAQAQAEEASTMRKRLDDENYIADRKQSSTATTPTPSSDANSKAGQATKKTAAAIAAEVADKLAASSSSQYIMTSVLSSFALEEAKNAGLTKAASTVPNNSVAKPMPKAADENPVSDPNIFVPAQPLAAAPMNNNPYHSVFLPQQMMQSQTPPTTSQAQYRMLPNPPMQQQYMQVVPSGGGIMNSYGYGSIGPMAPGPPPSLPPPMVSMMPLNQQQQPMQMTQQQPLALSHHPSGLTQQQQQQPPVPPNFRPLGHMQPAPGMVYYAQPHHSQ